MDYTVRKRKHKLINFMKNLKYTDSQSESSNLLKFFPNKKLINEGVEGEIYLTDFPNPLFFKDSFILKDINLISKNSEYISLTIDELYGKLLDKESFKNPIFIEIISNTLTNQLILQKICPHFAMNYYWDFISTSKLVTCNEYATSQDFESWAKKSHSIDLWFNAFFQIIVGILSIQKYFGMCHTDLHTGNILVQKVKPGGYWVYIINNFKYYVPNLGYVFLLHDFGFAWIDQKMYVDWHYDQTLSYITKHGWKFYDIFTFTKYLFNDKSYKVPSDFKNVINLFFENEFAHIFTKKYFKEQLSEISNVQKQKKLQKFLNTYPDIKNSYNFNNINLFDKLYTLFYDHSLLPNSIDKNLLNNINYSIKPKNINKIETYSLNKNFDKTKLAKPLLELLN